MRTLGLDLDEELDDGYAGVLIWIGLQDLACVCVGYIPFGVMNEEG